MSEEVDRKEVLQNIKVRTSVKNDCSWIKSGNNQPSLVVQKEQTKPVPAKKSALVLQASKKFESEDTAPSLPVQKTAHFPNKGDSANQGKVNPVSKDASSKESLVETTEDIKLQPTTEQLVQNCKAQEDKLVVNTNRENKEAEANVAVDKPDVNVNEKAGEVVKKEGKTQPDALGKQNPDVVCPVKPAEPSPANKTAEVKEEHADAPSDPSNMNNTEDKGPADAKVESCVTNASAGGGTSAKSDPAKVPAVTQVELKPKEEPVTKTEPSVKDASVEVSPAKGSSEKHPPPASNDPSDMNNIENKSPADAKVENFVAKASAGGGKSASSDPAKVPAVTQVELKPKEEPVTKAEPAKATVKDASVEVSPAKGSSEKRLPPEANDPSDMNNIENKAPADAKVENFVAKASAGGGKSASSVPAKVPAVTQVEPKPKEEPLSKPEPAKATVKDASVEVSPEKSLPPEPNDPSDMNNIENKSPADAKVENFVAKASAGGGKSASSVPAKVPAVTQVELKPKEEPVTKAEPAKATVKDASVEVSPAKGSSEKRPPPASNEAAALVKPKLLPEISDLAADAAGKNASLQARVHSATPVKPVSSSLAKPSNDSPTQSSSEQDGNKVLVDGEVLESPAVVSATPRQEASPLNSVQPLSVTLPESPAAESAFKSAVCEVDAAAPAEPAPKTRTEEVVEHKVRSVEESVTLPREDAFDHMTELDIKDAVEPEPAADTQDDLVNKLVADLTDALDFKAESNEPMKPKDSEKTRPEEQKQKFDDTNMNVWFKKPAGEINSTQTPKRNSIRSYKSTCYYCNRTIDGNVRIIVNEPAMICHQECLECGVCAKALGDLLTAMFLHKNLIHCKDCFKKAVNLD